MNIAAVICAAGSSTRMGGIKKEYRPLEDRVDAAGKPLTVLGAAFMAFTAVSRVNLIVIAVPPGDKDGEAVARQSLPQTTARVLFVPGGSTRRGSTHYALALLAPYNPDYVLVHDGARPWVDPELIERIIDALVEHKAVIPLMPLIETPKEIDERGFVCRHLKRARVGTAQTPQAFAFAPLLRAHECAAERESREGVEYTDDAEVWGEFVGPVAVISGSPYNRKITFPEDL
jgi:2-C-methyl-D-erythritol 4-phosphate cytidylyltransferase/2-C-methyl-D-erythritol 4-phosphate cytidylyltransferase/2-C-methyl-D-erythritol 2,4-cyclodiphosphate synthase